MAQRKAQRETFSLKIADFGNSVVLLSVDRARPRELKFPSFHLYHTNYRPTSLPIFSPTDIRLILTIQRSNGTHKHTCGHVAAYCIETV